MNRHQPQQKINEMVFSDHMPECIKWDCDEVAQWVEDIGFPEYKECFVKNFINGQKLIVMQASQMPKIGVYKMEDILALARAIRALLGFDRENSGVQNDISIPNPRALFLEQKCRTGVKSDRLLYSRFIKENINFFEKFIL